MTDTKFTKSSRLLSVADFSNLKINSNTFKRSSVIIYFKRNTQGLARAGLSVSKKVGNSPMRNRYKRIMREFFRTSKVKDLGFDILFVVSFTRSQEKLIQDEKESLLLSHIGEFFNLLPTVK